MKRWLAVDPGERFWGFAIGSPETGLIQPLRVIEGRDKEAILNYVQRVISDYQIDRVIFGVPLKNMKWTLTAEKLFARIQFVARRVTGPEIYYCDESYTSTHQIKNRRRDDIAAANLLRIAMQDHDQMLTIEKIRILREEWLSLRKARPG